MSILIILVLMLGVMYVLMIRPQRQREADQRSMVDSAGVGDDIVTTGGIYGTITEVDGNDLVVEIAKDVSVHMTRRGVAAVLPPEEDEDEVVDAEADAEDTDEGPVTDGEEAVRSATGDAPNGDGRG